MIRQCDKKIVLQDGTEFYGYGFGAAGDCTAEIVFNTSMVGYQEILSDPSYTGQAIVMTYPLIGNYGMCEADYESCRPTASAMIVREYNDEPSNFRSVETLGQVMTRFGIIGIAGVDTRKLAMHIRDQGTCRVLITSADTSTIAATAHLQTVSLPTDQVSRVSTPKAWFSRAKEPKYHVAAIDCGMKRNIVRKLNDWGCDVTILPWNTTAQQVEALSPDGVFLSNGPGNPEDVPCVAQLVRQLRGKYPIFGICLGHQILALSYGAHTYKLKFGHRGGNHPVKNLLSGKVEITSQNHSYAVDLESLSQTPLEATHVNLLDGTVEGLRCEADHAFSVQYHPESAPGPQDSDYLFGEFIRMMEETRHA